MTGRNTELILLLFALAIVTAGFFLIAQTTGEPTAVALKLAGILAAGFLAVHVVERIFVKFADPVLLPLAAALSGLGLAFVWRLKPNLGLAQSVWLAGGAVALILALVILRRYQFLKDYKYLWALGGVALLFAPIFIGAERGGAKLWLDFGPISFQPAEIAKVSFVFFLAAYLEQKRELLAISTKRIAGLWAPEPKHLGPLLFMWLISLAILVLERDLGTSLLFFGLFLAMLYVATGRTMYVSIGSLLFAGGATICYFLFSHVQTRVDIWLNPWLDPSGKGYQIVQSLFAIAGGGLTGTGLGLGHPGLIPAVQTDFIFSAVAEELGLLGGVAVILCYLLFVARGLKIALTAADDFGRLVAVGLSCVFALQSFSILGGVTKLIPLTGVTLPFMSYGGSSILMNFILLAMLLAISNRAGEAYEN